MSDKTIAQQVVNAIINHESVRDPQVKEIHGLSSRLSTMCKELGVDETQTQTGFHAPLSNLALDVIKSEQYKELLKNVENKTEEVESELTKLKAKYEMGKIEEKRYPSQREEIKKDVDDKSKNGKRHRIEAREIEKKLEELGFTSSLSDQSMKKLECLITDQEAELEGLMAQLDQLEGVEPDDEAIKKKLGEMKEELNNFKLLNDSNSHLFD